MCLVRLFVFVIFGANVSFGDGRGLPFIFKWTNHTDFHAPITSRYNPCENFYAYTCNAWSQKAIKPPYEPIWSPWTATNHKIKQRLSKLLTHHHDTNLKEPKLFYHSCLQSENQATKYLEELIVLIESLGGWPLVHKTKNYHQNSWLTLLSNITSLLSIHPILKIHVDLDYKDPKNHVVYIEPGDLIFPKYILTETENVAELEVYEKWIFQTATHIFGTIDDMHSIKEIIEIEIQLAKLLQTKTRNDRMAVKRLYKNFPGDWLMVLQNIFGNFMSIDQNTQIVIKNYGYMKNLFQLLQRTHVRKIINYLIWFVIKDLSRHTTQHMRHYNFLVDQAILGVKSDVPRDYECIDEIIKYFSPLLVRPYLKTYINSKIFPKITSIFNEIKNEFMKILSQSTWLSSEAKLLTVEKIHNIKLNLGYPPKDLHKEYFYHKIHMTMNHFTNILILRNLQQMVHFAMISKKNNFVFWPSSPFDVNAYYSVLQNSVFIPLPLVESPFFESQQFNYGRLGFLIAHEISHALDSTGILADATGKIRKWLPTNDIQAFKKQIQCFGNDSTVGENIADQNGLEISLNVLKRLKSGRGLKNFFINFAQMWCEESESPEVFTGEEHSPNFKRVQNLINNKDFSETFVCNSGSECKLW